MVNYDESLTASEILGGVAEPFGRVEVNNNPQIVFFFNGNLPDATDTRQES